MSIKIRLISELSLKMNVKTMKVGKYSLVIALGGPLVNNLVIVEKIQCIF